MSLVLRGARENDLWWIVGVGQAGAAVCFDVPSWPVQTATACFVFSHGGVCDSWTRGSSLLLLLLFLIQFLNLRAPCCQINVSVLYHNGRSNSYYSSQGQVVFLSVLGKASYRLAPGGSRSGSRRLASGRVQLRERMHLHVNKNQF